jgi:hypothetical protein
MADLRYRTQFQITHTTGDWTAPAVNIDSGWRTLSNLDEADYRTVQIGAQGGGSDTLDMNTEALRGGILQVHFWAVNPDQDIYLSRTGNAAEQWLLRSNEWTIIAIEAPGINTPLHLANTVAASPEVTVRMIIAGV